MNDQPVRALKKLIAQHGAELSADPRRTEALLNDICPTCRREVFVLVNAQRQHVPADLLAAPKWMPAGAVENRLSRRLVQNLALSEEAADWAVGSWASALGLRTEPNAIAKLLAISGTGLRAVLAPKPHRLPEGQMQQHDVQSSVTGVRSGEPLLPVDPRAGQRPPAARRDTADSHISPRAYARLAIVVASLAIVWVLAVEASTWDGLIALAGRLSYRSASVESVYSLPRVAWVGEGPLRVRAGPDTSKESITMLEAGQSVQVTGLSRDSEWSHIVEPSEGWVSNKFLNFLASDTSGSTVRLLFQEMQTVTGRVPVYASPVASGEPLAELDAGDPVTTIAVTPDGRWRQISLPIEGWVASHHLAPLQP